MVERLFGVSRRRAIGLMRSLGAYQAGNTLVVDRAVILERLHALNNDGGTAVERYRKDRLTARLEEVQHNQAARAVRIPVAADVHYRRVPELPAGITLEVGRLVIEFDGVLELLSKLYELSQAAANDYDLFCAKVEKGWRHGNLVAAAQLKSSA
jgi:hypothetical protein